MRAHTMHVACTYARYYQLTTFSASAYIIGGLIRMVSAVNIWIFQGSRRSPRLSHLRRRSLCGSRHRPGTPIVYHNRTGEYTTFCKRFVNDI